ncbi:pentapeptide repeat-containing protein, partial [candidate division KSB1 bacterium]|nr:pentapeptide repeat-containing protein [candidate division KSB1 bacterium]
EANLRKVDLRGANLHGANLQGADLQGADLDFSVLSLNCGSFNIIADDRFVAQIFCHWARFDVSKCSAHVRYFHRVATNLFGKYMSNLFCKYREDVEPLI